MAKKRLPKQVKPKARTLTVRAITSEQIKALDNLMDFTGAKTVTGAIFAAGTQLPTLKSNLGQDAALDPDEQFPIGDDATISAVIALMSDVEQGAGFGASHWNDVVKAFDYVSLVS